MTKICFVHSGVELAEQAAKTLIDRHGNHDLDQADVIVALGGDGFMLHMLHKSIHQNLPIYGINCGTVGFLMNEHDLENVPERIAAAKSVTMHPLKMVATDQNDQNIEALAINEVSLLREPRQAAKIQITIDGEMRLEELVCDGILVATSAGSTAYNLSAHGPIIPLGSNLLALTPISAFRPRRWRGALIPNKSEVTLDILHAHKRPVSVVADSQEFRNIKSVKIREDKSVTLNLLFDKGHDLEERILMEQFITS